MVIVNVVHVDFSDLNSNLKTAVTFPAYLNKAVTFSRQFLVERKALANSDHGIGERHLRSRGNSRRRSPGFLQSYIPLHDTSDCSAKLLFGTNLAQPFFILRKPEARKIETADARRGNARRKTAAPSPLDENPDDDSLDLCMQTFSSTWSKIECSIQVSHIYLSLRPGHNMYNIFRCALISPPFLSKRYNARTYIYTYRSISF